MKTKKLIIISLAAGLVVGFWLRGGGNHEAHRTAETAASSEEAPAMFTCSMHPQIRQPGPGLCPICAMELIPVKAESDARVGPRALAMSAAARELAKVETAVVDHHTAQQKIPLTGMVAYDTTRTRYVTMLSEGQIRKIYADYTGKKIRKGEPLADIYSPEVFAASRELVVAGSSSNMAAAAKQKLHLLGVSEAEINTIATSGKPTDTYTMISPHDGVMDSPARHEGHWLMRGEDVAELVDISSMWVNLDAYERDVGLMKIGDMVDLRFEAYPGEVFTGTISFIAPDMDAMKRTIAVRLDVPNADGRLKSGMFVRAEVAVPVPGQPLLIPASAPLITGKRAVVYVESPDEPGVFEGRDVVLGVRVGDAYVVREGLKPGERVAVKGAMRIDSSLQILAKPSMMSPTGGVMPPGHNHGSMSDADAPMEMKPQTVCPVEGGKIKRDLFADYNGLRVYFCCPGCDEDFRADPEKYLSAMRAKGIEPEKIP